MEAEVVGGLALGLLRVAGALIRVFRITDGVAFRFRTDGVLGIPWA